MSTAAGLRDPFDSHPLARETIVAVVLVGAFAVWASTVLEWSLGFVRTIDVDLWITATDSFAGQALVSGLVAVLTMLVFAGAYASLRDFEVSVGRVDRAALGYAGAGALGAAGLVLLVKASAVLTGSSLSAAAGEWIGANTDPTAIAVIAALGLFVTLPAYLLVAHVLVQRTLDRVASDRVVVALTTLLVGAVGPENVLGTDLVLEGMIFGLLALAIALPVLATALFEKRWLTVLTAVPLAVFAAGFAFERITAFAGVTDGLYALATVVVVAFGVAAYQRTESMVPSAVAYTAFAALTTVTVFALEAGLQP